MTFESKNEQGETIAHELNFDICHAVPPQSAPDFIKNSPFISDPKNVRLCRSK
ncbi:MAG: hypothetical protein R2822_07330 [Spirosomataceae bacterium]